MTEQQINELIKLDHIDTNLISDGYHTFGELYEHRITNFIALCRILNNYQPYSKIPIWLSKKHSDGSSWNGWFILGIFEEKGKQITYHLPIDKYDECVLFAKELMLAPEWDGHTSADVLERLKNL